MYNCDKDAAFPIRLNIHNSRNYNLQEGLLSLSASAERDTRTAFKSTATPQLIFRIKGGQGEYSVNLPEISQPPTRLQWHCLNKLQAGLQQLQRHGRTTVRDFNSCKTLGAIIPETTAGMVL